LIWYAYFLNRNEQYWHSQSHKDLPHQFLTSAEPLVASLVIGSFGSSTPYKSKVFDLAIERDPNVPLSVPEAPLRYAAEPEIHHIFKDDPKSPPKIITIVFAAAVAAALPILLGVWATLGANASHLSKALGNAPVSHGLFYGSILAMEGIFFLYYTSWNLFQTLPAAAVVGFVAFLSGSRALSEVQERRLAGLRWDLSSKEKTEYFVFIWAAASGDKRGALMTIYEKQAIVAIPLDQHVHGMLKWAMGHCEISKSMHVPSEKPFAPS
jgi:hypothetical protein